MLDASETNAEETTATTATRAFPLRAARNQYPAVGTYEGEFPAAKANGERIRVAVEVTETDVAVTAPSADDLAAFAGEIEFLKSKTR